MVRRQGNDLFAKRSDFLIAFGGVPLAVDQGWIDAGATRAITQFFFDHEVYLRFLDRTRDAGISAPIIPGILPVTNFAAVQRFAATCGASVPAWMAELFEGLDDSPDTRQLVAATVATLTGRRKPSLE